METSSEGGLIAEKEEKARTINLNVAGPGDLKNMITLHSDAPVAELTKQIKNATGYKVTLLSYGIHTMSQNKKLSDYPLDMGHDIKADGTIDGGMPKLVETEEISVTSAEESEHEPEADN